MTDQELREIVAETSRVVRDLGERSERETARLRQTLEAESRKTNEEIRKTQEEIRKTQEEGRRTQEEVRKTQKIIQQLARQIGGVGNKFGSFTEGLAWGSIERMLRREFGADHTDYNLRRVAKAGNDEIEVDALGWNRSNVYVVEVKSYLHSDELKRMMRNLAKFPKLFPEYAARKIYGVMVAVEIAEGMEEAVSKKGIYLARADDHLFKLISPAGFAPKVFSANGKPDGNGSRKRKANGTN